jgi:ribose transport system substrate-binding protein
MNKLLGRCLTATALAAGLILVAGVAEADGYKIVSGPGYLPECFAAFPNSKFFQWSKKPGPYRIALVNGFVGNTWRIQMIKSAKAYVEEPSVKPLIKEFSVVSTGTDPAAQLAAVDNYINQGFDAILTIAVSPAGMTPVVTRANQAGVVFINFDNKADTDKIMQVTHDAVEMGRIQGRWLVDNVKPGGTILEVRGLQGTGADRDRSKGFHEVLEGSGKNYKITQVVGNWDSGTTQKVTADSIAVYGHFDGIADQGGSDGAVQAMIDSHHPFVPFAGAGENGFNQMCAEHVGEGLRCLSVANPPAISAAAIKAAIAALQGETLPQDISLALPVIKDPEFKQGVNYFPDLGISYFPINQLPTCGITAPAEEVLKQSVN